MAGVVFSHPNASIGELSLRLAPKQVDWNFALNTSTQDTYAGEVVQLLSINFDKLVIVGQFGTEGPWGKAAIADGRIFPRKRSDRDDFRSTEPYAVGLTQMTEYFRRYFSVASQGRDAVAAGHYSQQPMRVTYHGALDVDVDDGLTEGDWHIYPTSFPSFRRTNVDFAPEWRIEGDIVEPDPNVERASMKEEIERLRSAVGFTHFNPYSDPFTLTGGKDPRKNLTPERLEALYQKARKNVLEDSLTRLDHYRTIFGGEFTDEALNELLQLGGSTMWGN